MLPLVVPAKLSLALVLLAVTAATVVGTEAELLVLPEGAAAEA